MSIEHQAPAVAEPDESGAALVDELLAELDAGRTGPLAEFVRAYVRRAPPPLRAEHTVPELAAQVRSVFAFVNGRPPGELAVRAYNPELDRDGWSASGSVVDVNVEDAPFLVDTVTSEIHAFSCQVRVVLHPVMGVERAEDGTIEAVTPARGAPRRESVMHFQIDRRLDDAALEALDGVASSAASRACGSSCATSCRWSSGSSA